MPTVLGVLDSTNVHDETFRRIAASFQSQISDYNLDTTGFPFVLEVCQDFLGTYADAPYRVLNRTYAPTNYQSLPLEQEQIVNIVIEILNHM
jgi:hypothetical protein